MKKNFFVLCLSLLAWVGFGGFAGAQETERAVPCLLTADDGDFYSDVEGTWQFEQASHCMITVSRLLADRVPLYSKGGIRMDPGLYRITMEYKAGEYLETEGESGELVSMKWVDPFYVKVGTEGSDVSEMQEVYRDLAGFTDAKLATVSFTMSIAKEGNYVFALEPSAEFATFEPDVLGGWELALKSISVEKFYAHDLAISRVESNLPHNTMLEQANGRYLFDTYVQNKGKDTTQVQLAFYWEDDLETPFYTRKSMPKIPNGVTGWMKDTVDFSGIESLGKKNFVIRANVVDNGVVDSNAYDNSYLFNLTVTDSVMAFDTVGPDLWNAGYRPAMGRAMAPISFGLPYHLVKADTLTSVTFAFAAPLSPVIPFSFRIYKWDEEKEQLSYQLYSADLERPQDSGYFTYSFRPMFLQPGSYMLEVAQRNDNFLGIYSDEEAYGYAWITSSDPVKKQTGVGFIVARMNFGRPGGEVYPTDLAVSSIDKPGASGVFTQNQIIEASVFNQGTTATGGKVYCMVNGDVLEKSVDLPVLDPFAKTTVKFNADLQDAGEYEIKVFVVAEGDTYPANDTLVKKVVSLGTPDNYVMDFEFCTDYDYVGLKPWTPKDLDTNMTITISGMTIPNAGQRMAYMAYDNAMIPGAEGFDWMKAPQGRMAGLCLAANPGPNDDWLISPKLRLPESGSSVSFRVASMDKHLAKYEVLVSTTNALPRSFKRVGDVRTAEEAISSSWPEVTVDLAEYDGKSVYVAIRCVQSDDSRAMLIDDIRVSKPGAGTVKEDVSAYLRLYPNPASRQITIDGMGLDLRRVEIINLYGARIYDSGNMSGEFCRLGVENWADGMYFARVTTERGVHTLKFVVR